MKSKLIDLIVNSAESALLANDLQGRILGSQIGRIIDVDDPLQLGRVKVVLDSRTNELTEYASNWVHSLGGFTGKQPQSLIGKRVNVDFTNGDPKRGIITDIVQDVLDTLDQPASTMVRLPIYKVGELPPANERNRGCVVLIIDDEYGDYQTVCLKRNGKYVWERLIAQDHTHRGSTDQPQPPDSDGNSQQPVDNSSIVVYDKVIPHTDSPYRGGRGSAS